MAEGGEISYRSPYGAAADDISDTTVQVCLVIPGLKRKRMNKKKIYGELNVAFDTRSIDVKARLDTSENGKKKSEHFQYNVKRLPHDIVPDKSKFRIEDGKVFLLLHKAKPVSWVQDLSTTGLETDHGA